MSTYNIGYVAGVFDLFHIGHLNLIRKAKQECDHLIVGVLTDELVVHFKKNLPFIPFAERIEIVGALKYVDEAVPVTFENIDKMDAWNRYHFDCLFSGDDYVDNPVWKEDAKKLEQVGACIHFFEYTKSTNSTKIKGLINQKLREE